MSPPQGSLPGPPDQMRSLSHPLLAWCLSHLPLRSSPRATGAPGGRAGRSSLCPRWPGHAGLGTCRSRSPVGTSTCTRPRPRGGPRSPPQRDTIQIVVLDPHEADAAVGQDGGQHPFLLLLHQDRHEVLHLRHVHVAAVIPADEHLGRGGRRRPPSLPVPQPDAWRGGETHQPPLPQGPCSRPRPSETPAFALSIPQGIRGERFPKRTPQGPAALLAGEGNTRRRSRTQSVNWEMPVKTTGSHCRSSQSLSYDSLCPSACVGVHTDRGPC